MKPEPYACYTQYLRKTDVTAHGDKMEALRETVFNRFLDYARNDKVVSGVKAVFNLTLSSRAPMSKIPIPSGYIGKGPIRTRVRVSGFLSVNGYKWIRL